MQISLTQSMLNTITTNGSNAPQYYTWRLIDELENSTIFYANNYSADPTIFGMVDIIISETEIGLTAGIINCSPGLYDYQIHQMPEPFDLNLNNSLSIVQEGQLIITKK